MTVHPPAVMPGNIKRFQVVSTSLFWNNWGQSDLHSAATVQQFPYFYALYLKQSRYFEEISAPRQSTNAPLHVYKKDIN